MKEDNISQLGDYDIMTRHSVNDNIRMGLVISLCLNSNPFDQFNTPQTASYFRHLLSCGTVVSAFSLIKTRRHQDVELTAFKEAEK